MSNFIFLGLLIYNCIGLSGLFVFYLFNEIPVNYSLIFAFTTGLISCYYIVKSYIETDKKFLQKTKNKERIQSIIFIVNNKHLIDTSKYPMDIYEKIYKYNSLHNNFFTKKINIFNIHIIAIQTFLYKKYLNKLINEEQVDFLQQDILHFIKKEV